MIFIDGYPIDAALTETHTYQADVTAYPVESGSLIADNVQPKPATVEMECIVSDSPLGDVLRKRRALNLADPAFTDVPSSEAFDRLITVMNTREPVTIETSLKIYTNMVLTSFVPTVDKSTGRALKFNCAFTQVQIRTNLRTRIRVASPAGTPQKKSKISNPAVVLLHTPGAGESDITTLSGQAATWNPETGRYEYAYGSNAGNAGAPVPSSDLGDYSKYGRTTAVPDGGIPDDPSALGADGKPVNSTYYNYQDDSWKNTDGSPVTQQQLAKKQTLPTQGQTAATQDDDSDTPWWQPKNGLGSIGPGSTGD